jgi:bacterioferritin (cytochrome b1)
LDESFPAGEEQHIDWLATQLGLIAGIRLQNHQQSML